VYEENWARLGYFVESSGNFSPTFSLRIGPIFKGQESKKDKESNYSLRSNPEELISHPLRGRTLKLRIGMYFAVEAN
jgi:hypothetical protein